MLRGHRRAARRGPGWIEIAAAAAAATASVVVGGTLLAFSVARHAVTPVARRTADVVVHDVDVAAQTIVLSRTPDTVLPGRYGLFVTGTRRYLKLGAVLGSEHGRVTRKLLTQITSDDRIGRAAAFSGWYFDAPDQLHLPFEEATVSAPVGDCPAWLFPASDEEASTWAIAVHGRGTTRAEVLRAVPVFREAGLATLVVSYRNDTEAPTSSSGRYGLGATEWRDVEAAISFALGRGAKRIVLMGWSMGGAIVLQTALNTAHRDAIAGLVLDSPVVDWRSVLSTQARVLRVPRAVAGVAMRQLNRPRWSRAVRWGNAISLDELDIVRRADELSHPVLLLHSDDDGFVPSGASHHLAEARPDLVDLKLYRHARHTKLWNYDEDRWRGEIRAWLDAQGLSAS